MSVADLRARITRPEAQDQFKRWFDAAPIYSGPPVANRLGWQVTRTVAKRAAIGARRRPLRLDDDAARRLDRDGIVAIPNFLRADDFAEVQDACRSLRVAPQVRDIGQENGSGIGFWTGPVTEDAPDSPGAVVNRLLGQDERLIGLARHVIGRRICPPLRVVYQRLALEDGERDQFDREQVLHADKAFPCVKAIFAVQDISEGSSPFIYSRGTHRLTFARLRYEHAMATSESRRRRDGPVNAPVPEGVVLERGRSVMGSDLRRRLGVVEEPMSCTANTMILTNNAGFHRRGQLDPGAERETLWINFYPYQRPFYGKLAFRAVKTVIDTDSVTRELAAYDRVSHPID